jgi:hypothetical protein
VAEPISRAPAGAGIIGAVVGVVLAAGVGVLAGLGVGCAPPPQAVPMTKKVPSSPTNKKLALFTDPPQNTDLNRVLFLSQSPKSVKERNIRPNILVTQPRTYIFT